MTHLTATYSSIHAAITDAARDFDVDRLGARIVLAAADAGGEIVSDDLAAALELTGGNESMIRRSLLTLYSRGLAVAAGADGGPRRRGVRTRVTLTARGGELAAAVVERFANGGADS